MTSCDDDQCATQSYLFPNKSYYIIIAEIAIYDWPTKISALKVWLLIINILTSLAIITTIYIEK